MNEAASRTKAFHPLTRLQHLHRASRSIAAARDEAAVGQALVDFAIAGDAHAIRLLIFTNIVDDQPTTIEMREGWTVDDRPTQPYGTRLSLTDYPFMDLMGADSITVCENVETDERLNEINRQIMAASGLKSFVTIPLATRQHWLGVLFLGRNTPSTYDQELIYTWWTLAGQAAAALENQRLLAQVRREGQRQRQLARAVEATADAVVITDRAGIIQFVNTAFERITGYAAAEAMGQNSSILQSDIHDEAFYKQMWETVTSGQVWRGEVTNKRKDGSFYELQLVISPILDEQGEISRFVSVQRDVTAQKQAETERERAEEVLRESEAQYRALFEAANDAIFTMKEDRFISCNAKTLEIFGCTREQILGQPPYRFSPELQPDGRDSMEKALEKIGLALQGKPQFFEWLHSRYDSTPFDADVSLSRLEIGGEMLLQAIVRDTTERKKAQAERERLLVNLESRAVQLQTAAEVSRAASTILDPQTLIQQAVDLIRERFKLYYAGLFLVDESEKTSRWAILRAGTGEAGQQMMAKGHQLEIGGDSMIGSCVATAQTRIALDVGQEARRFDNPYLPQTRSEMALPLVSRDQVIGAMTIQSTQEAAFSEDDSVVLQTMADQVANAIENARLYAQARQQTQEQTGLARIATLAGSTLEINELLDRLMEEARQMIGAELAVVLFEDMEQKGLIGRYVSAKGVPQQAIEEWYIPLDTSGFEQSIFTRGEAYYSNSALDDPNLIPTYRSYMEKLDVRNFCGVAIRVRERSIGELYLANRPGGMGQDQIRILQIIAGHTANAIANARMLEETQLALTKAETLAQEQAVLNELSQALTARLNVHRVLEEAYRGASRLMDITNFSIGLYDPEKDEIAFLFDVTESVIDERITVISADQGISGHIVSNRTSVLLEDNVRERQEALGIEMVGEEPLSWLGVPLLIGDQVLGVIIAQSFSTPHAYTEHERDLLTAIAGQAAIAIQNARLLEETQASLAETEALYQASQEIGDVLDLKAVVERLANVARRMTQADCSVVVTLDPETGTIEHLKSAGVDLERYLERYPIVDMPEGQGILAAVLEGETIRTTDITTHPRAAGLPEWHFPVRSLLGMPLLYQEQVRGMLLVGDPSGQRIFDAADEKMLGTFAAQASIVIQNARLFEAQTRHRQEAETLRHVTTALTSILDVNQVLDLILEQLAVVVTYDSAAIMLVEGPNLVVAAGRGFPDTADVTNMAFNIEEDPLFRQMRDDRASLILADVQADERFLGKGGTSYVRSWMSIPMLIRDQMIGCLSIDSRQIGAFGPQEAEFGQTYANQAVMALENARLFEQTQTRARREQVLRQVMTAISASEDLVAGLPAIIEHLRGLAPIDAASLTTYTQGAPEFQHFVVATQSTERPAQQGIWRPLKGSGPGWVIAHKEPWRATDLRQKKTFDEDEQLVDEGLVSRLLLPLRIGTRVVGTLNLASTQPGAFTEEHVPTLSQVADQLALALERARLLEETQAALTEVEAVHRRYLREQWEGLLSSTSDRTWGYVDNPDGLTPIMSATLGEAEQSEKFWSLEIEKAIATNELATVIEPIQPQEESTAPPAQRRGLAMPIRLRGQTIGVLDFYDDEKKRPWTLDEKALVDALSDQIAQALETHRLFEQSQRRAYREQLTGEIVGKIRASGDVRGILETTAGELGRALGVSRALIRLGNPNDDKQMREAVETVSEVKREEG